MCWRPATLLKETPRQVFPCKFCEIFKKTLFCRTLRWLLLFFVNPYLPNCSQTVTSSSGDLCRLDTNSVVWFYPSIIYMFKVNNGNTRTMCEICSKLTIKTTERRHWRQNDVIYFTHCSGVTTVDFEQMNAIWVAWYYGYLNQVPDTMMGSLIKEWNHLCKFLAHVLIFNHLSVIISCIRSNVFYKEQKHKM